MPDYTFSPSIYIFRLRIRPAESLKKPRHSHLNKICPFNDPIITIESMTLRQD